MPHPAFLSAPPGHHALRKGRVSVPGGVYLITATTLQRTSIFTDFDAACAAASAFTRPTVLGRNTLFAWVLMPDHVHWLLQLGEDEDLAKSIGRMKAVSAREVRRAGGWQGAVWAPAFHDRALRHEEDLLAVARYVVANPLRARLVSTLREYPFWNAVWL
ncbi:transposase [Pseudomonas sp. PDNC002]|uniref:REP-associated tyrosine transposase n=1 Tax=Pseudomonas sp. PDNC002 TaxID=2811422 RepID=UPI0019630184|nr:transposase [Pseudomonas sp. PDNC002]QRY77291.1 transposase [Pseudomonas sp. PDNC002]